VTKSRSDAKKPQLRQLVGETLFKFGRVILASHWIIENLIPGWYYVLLAVKECCFQKFELKNMPKLKSIG